ncbi:hypothetical protein Leryth_000512 [Lithospermum erythrorhizon]|uniref:DNA-binding transcription factor n=1 Tax=Lithospermum erythrorhizon TaxID=34254 RepID=A0AAV3PXQ9_LITER|nr:hypothetical protein Leryth_000512 [Lithospermum erythrorhizon]
MEMMNMSSVKTEENSSKCTMGVMEGSVQEVKYVKRRRRTLITASSSSQVQDGQEPSQALQADTQTTSATPTTSTVKRSSRFRGVSRHRWTGRYEAHLWDKGTWNATQKKKGKQGAYDEEESAARAYDLAATKYWGTSTFTNFPISDYAKEIEIMQHVTRGEYLASLRRRSNGFARGASKYRGVARHHHNGRWEARIGRAVGNKYLYLGTYSTQEEAAHAYDIAAIEYRGINAVTNFELSSYIRWLKPGDQPPATEGLINPNEIYSRAISEFSLNNSNHFSTLGYSIPYKPEIVETKLPIGSSTKPTSPTALGLLLRSSMFKELKEKNPNAGNEETEINFFNDNSQDGVVDVFTLHNGGEDVAFGFPYSGENLLKLECPGSTSSVALDDQTRQQEKNLWDNFLIMQPPSAN